MTSNVTVFPILGTPLANWYNTAKSVAEKHGLERAQVYIHETVPDQFRDIIEKNVRLRYENTSNP